MDFEFKDIMAQHEAKYPLMNVQDYVKLAYQNEFGPLYLAEKEKLYQGIRSELMQLSSQGDRDAAGVCAEESIGNGLSRISLCGLPHPDTDGKLLAQLMVLTIGSHSGRMEDFEEKLKMVEQKLAGDEEAKAWLKGYRAGGCSPVSHSETYRDAYDPHYRVVKTQYANWLPVLSEIAHLLAGKQSVVISIDGRCGSGKSSLADVIKEVFSCNVFHMDDFYLPPQKRAADWQTIPAGNMDLERFRTEVLQPAKEGQEILYRPYDCQTGQLAGPETVLPTQLTVVEGSYSQHPLLTDQYDLKIFLTCDPDVQRERLTAREGKGVHSFFTHWIPMEEGYFAAYNIEEKNDLTLNTGRFGRPAAGGMEKQDIIEFFNQCAPGWDAEMIRSDEIINIILDYAGVCEGKDILDVACGTGVLIPDYLDRKAASVTAIDIAPEMVRLAKEKFHQENVQIICGDAETFEFGREFDCIVVYNAFPHFAEPERLIRVLASHLKPGGVLTVAHGMSRDEIDRCHAGGASKVSIGLMHEDKLAEIFKKYLRLEVKISNEKMYIVAGSKRSKN